LGTNAPQQLDRDLQVGVFTLDAIFKPKPVGGQGEPPGKLRKGLEKLQTTA
jgi:hypothetical protein